MNHRLLIGVGVLLVILPHAADGQTRGTRSPDWDKMSRTSSPSTAPQLLSKKDMEGMDPIKRLIEKRKDLKLTDGQLAKLKEMEGSAKTRDASMHETMDSLRNVLRPPSGTRPNEADRLRLNVAREHYVKAVMGLRAASARRGLIGQLSGWPAGAQARSTAHRGSSSSTSTRNNPARRPRGGLWRPR